MNKGPPFPGCKPMTQVLCEIRAKYFAGDDSFMHDVNFANIVLTYSSTGKSPPVLRHWGSKDVEHLYFSTELEKWWHARFEKQLAERVLRALKSDG